MKRHRHRKTGGFTIIELLVVIVLIAILAAIVLPTLRSAIMNAEAANILGDVRAVQIAYSNFIADGGTRAGNSGWGRTPVDLEPHLPDGLSFATDVADYRWTRLRQEPHPGGLKAEC